MASLRTSTTVKFIIVTLLLIKAGHSPATAFYLPGSYPQRYHSGDALAAKVNSLTSPTSKLPYPYYSLPFCAPRGGVRRAAESLGELLLGDRIETSPYRFSMLANTAAPLFLCRTDPLTSSTAALIRSRIDDAYQVNLLLDTLPAVRYIKSPVAAEDVLLRSTGFPVGVRADDGEYYVYNHLRITVLVNRQNATTRVETLMATAEGAELISFSGTGKEGGAAEWYTVVGFEVVPCSVDYHGATGFEEMKMYDEMVSSKSKTAGCDPSVVGQRVQEDAPLAFSYEVAFVESPVQWPSRWDPYLEMGAGGGRVHWFSILNSMVVVAFLAAIVLVILLRTVRRDLAQYEELGDDEAGGAHPDELAGWKLVAGDVFREPSRPVLLCVVVGDGVRILGMGVVTILFAALGFMSPACRGALVSGMLCFYLVLGAAAGYASVTLWKTIHQGDITEWKSVAWRASFAFPGVGFLIFTILNGVLWHNGSTGAVPFLLFLIIILLWFFVSVPLTLAGGLLASRARHVAFPVKVNKIPRHVAPARCSPWVLVAAAGTLPFGTLFIELFFIMSSLWLGRVYYVFGFLLVVLALLVIVCAEVSVVITYVGLCVEDWRWWWRAFFASGSVAIYVLAYAVYYLVFDLHSLAGPVSAALYVGYSLLMALAVMLATGAVGLAASFCFVHYLFSAVKLD